MKNSAGFSMAFILSLLGALAYSAVSLQASSLPQGEVLNRSGDAYVRQAGTQWLFGTARVQKRLRFEKGHLLLASFQDADDNHELIQGPPSEVFRFEVNGQVVTSESRTWVLEGSQTEILSQGDLLFRVVV